MANNYISTQRKHYAYALQMNNLDAAFNALWLAAQSAQLLLPGESGQSRYSATRREKLLISLGWTDIEQAQ